MMDDYIRREDAVKIAEKYGLENGSVLGRHTGVADCIASEISALPAANVAEVVHGTPVTEVRTRTIVGYHEEIGVLAGDRSTLYRRNMVHADIPYDHCPICGATLCSRWHNFCGKCGAKMDGCDGSVADDLERKLAETGKLVPRFYGDYVFSPCQNAFNGKTSWWLSKKGCTVAIYCFTAGTTAEADAQLSVGGGQAYIQMFEERTGGSEHE